MVPRATNNRRTKKWVQVSPNEINRDARRIAVEQLGVEEYYDEIFEPDRDDASDTSRSC